MDQLEKVVSQFYTALNKVFEGETALMDAVWSDAPYITAMHSLGDAEVGGQQVQAEWARLAKKVSRGEVSFESLQTHINGDMGFVVGVEQGSVQINGQEVPVNLRVTNIFERNHGVWKIIHHHADRSGAIERRID